MAHHPLGTCPGRSLHPPAPRAVPNALCSAALLSLELSSLSPLFFPVWPGARVSAGRAGTARVLAVRSSASLRTLCSGGCTHLGEGSQQPHGFSPSGHCCGKAVQPCKCCRCPPGRGSSCICGLCSYITGCQYAFLLLHTQVCLWPLPSWFIWQFLSVGRQQDGCVSAHECSAPHQFICVPFYLMNVPSVFLNVWSHFWVRQRCLVLWTYFCVIFR